MKQVLKKMLFESHKRWHQGTTLAYSNGLTTMQQHRETKLRSNESSETSVITKLRNQHRYDTSE